VSYYLLANSLGQVYGFADSGIAPPPLNGGDSVVEVDRIYSYSEIAELIFENGGFRAIGPKPSPHHIFNYTTKQWEDPRTAATEWAVVRAERDARLLACDWTQLPDVPLAIQGAWAAYRQALRDVPNQPDPLHIVWPVAPGGAGAR